MPGRAKTNPTVEHFKEENQRLRAEIVRLEGKLETHERRIKDYQRAIDSWRRSADTSDMLRIQLLTHLRVVLDRNAEPKHVQDAIQSIKSLTHSANL